MGSTNNGSVTLVENQSGADQEEDEPPQRGFFGRIFDALSPSDTSLEGEELPVQGPIRPASGTGMANLRKLRVDDVAVPKVEITAVPVTIGKEELVEVFRENGFSRMPVYKDTLDHPLGLVLLKDLALQYGFAGASGRFSLRKLLRPMLYAPPSMPLGVLLQKMQKDRVHMALVIDEYGGVDGLVTIEDLIETVIGQIDDEHDEVEGVLWKEDPEGVFLAQANAPLDEFEQALGVTLRGGGDDDGDVDTLGGLVFLRLGRIPARGEIIPHESGAEFEVVDADPRRIKRLRVRRPGAPRKLSVEIKAAAE
ncbi:CBS domain-containing protein [Pseudorhodobacter turbinis]|uniref:CBS domain-containing protein n=1 Tax=Pseudorhodobacter turbinis TaxID=2500533 RepID=A0A4P8EGQ7_9RHOB|nr:transporter associated domain-containing protein [Pseudorhodobacter turbinis]QCO56037.1 CBS domain-containing protein [Pseudorhodobacter turbinis]